MKYKNKKILILNSAAVAYSGVSSCIEDLKKFEKENKEDIKIDVLHYQYKKQKVKAFDGFRYEYEEFTMNEIEETVNMINKNYDFVILMTEAKMSKKYPIEFYRSFYLDLWKKIDIVKIRMQHDATDRAISLSPLNINISNEADAIFTISKESLYIKEILRNLPSKENRIFKYDLWLDFEMFDKWKSEEVEKENKLTYIGRYATFKNPDRLIDIAKELKNIGLTIELHGLDSDISTVSRVLNHEYVNDYVRKRTNPNGIVNAYGKYERLDGLNKMRKSLFGFSFFNYRLEKNVGFYGNRLEYAQQEIIACGSIPVFDKGWSENCKTRAGVRYCDIPYFALYCELGKEIELVDKLKEVMESKELQKKYVETSYRVLKENYDKNIIIPEFLNNICSVTKDCNKFKTEYDLAYSITNDKETSTKYQDIMDNKELLSSTTFSMLEKNEVHIFGGKTGKASIKQ